MNKEHLPKLLSWASLLIALIAISFYSLGSDTMTLFAKKVPINLSPEISGVIKDNGKPVAHIEVERSVYLNFTGDYYTDKVLTDSNGQFHFPEKTAELKKPSNLTTVVKRHELYVEYKNKHVPIWFMNIHTLNPVKVINEKLQGLNCDLNNQEQQFDFEDSDYPASTFSTLTLCRWNDN